MLTYQCPPTFEEETVLHHLHHYLPHQNPLKDFVNHNTLLSFQDLPFHTALETASSIFGYKTYLHLGDYRKLYSEGKINPKILQKVLIDTKGIDNLGVWERKLLQEEYDTAWTNRLGQLHQIWTNTYHLNIEKEVHSFLFRFVGSYIDQGVAMQKFPITHLPFLSAVRELEKHSRFTKIFRSKRVRHLLLHTHCTLKTLLDMLVGDETLYESYLFDQQFAHAGWSGMVAVLEQHPETLLDKRKITLHDFILFELLLEIDALDNKFGENNWQPLAHKKPDNLVRMFAPVERRELFEVYALWQEAYEWTFYDQALYGLQVAPDSPTEPKQYDFQGIFCIDDRECSFRRYVEELGNAQTFGSAGFFGVEFYFQPEGGKFYTKSCPPPITPKFLVKEVEAKKQHHKRDAHFSQQSKNLLGGWVISQTMGFWSAIQLAWNIFKPSETPALVSSFRHMDKDSKLEFEHRHEHQHTHDLQIGFTIEEMVNRMESLLKSIGLTHNFSNLVYIIGHGASNVNNPHYAAYGCGACSGQTGSVNARVAASMLNKPEVRAILQERGIYIPKSTEFVGALHDTTKDEMMYYDIEKLSKENKQAHTFHQQTFNDALAYNAKERSRRFKLIDSHQPVEKIHQQVKLRALSLFEPRSEWDHASNAMCIVSRRESNKHLFLDRRSFLNSYDYAQDLDGKYLLGILRAVAPVCGGINLQYYFSCTDQYRLGAGSKLPHNVIGLVGVANGMDGDLRIGLPTQALDIHDPIRLLAVVEHYPEIVLQTIQKEDATYEWFANYWVHLVVIHPETKKLYRFHKGGWIDYVPVTQSLPTTKNFGTLLEDAYENLPVYLLSQKI
ncbi:MAG: DUF2309 domain-containing protein [Bacteroidetes bacterium]|nr:MAG: DUF2309 domain-containing protein [Bacteroidota bacterium]